MIRALRGVPIKVRMDRRAITLPSWIAARLQGMTADEMTSPDLPAELKAALDARLHGLSRNDAAGRAASISQTYRGGGGSVASAPRPMRWPTRWRGCPRPMPR